MAMGLREIPFRDFMQTDLFEQGRPLFSQRQVSWIGFDQSA